MATNPKPPPPPLTSDQERLMELGLPMVMKCAHEIAVRYRGLVEQRDLLAEGTFALRETALTYREGEHPSFPVYARHHLRGRMIDAVRAEHFGLRARVERAMDRAYEVLEAHHEIEADLSVDDEDKLLEASRTGGDELLAATVLAGIAAAEIVSPEERLVDRITLRELLARLYPHEREVVRLVIEEGMTLDEVAAEIHVHHNTAQRRYKSGLRKLRGFLVERGQDTG